MGYPCIRLHVTGSVCCGMSGTDRPCVFHEILMDTVRIGSSGDCSVTTMTWSSIAVKVATKSGYTLSTHLYSKPFNVGE